MIDAKSFLKHMHILQSFCIAVFLSLFRHNKTPKVFCPTFGVHVKMSGLFYFKITKYYTKYRIFKSLFNFIRVSFEKFF